MNGRIHKWNNTIKLYDNYLGDKIMDKHILELITTTDWSQYETAYGNASEDIPCYVQTGDNRGCTPKIKQSLTDLFSDDTKTAMQATHDLWCGLCHQHSFVSSAALPAFDILLYALQNLNDEIKVEILDILFGFAICTSDEDSPASWHGQLREKLKQNKEYIQSLVGHKNEEIDSFAKDIMEELQ